MSTTVMQWVCQVTQIQFFSHSTNFDVAYLEAVVECLLHANGILKSNDQSGMQASALKYLTKIFDIKRKYV